jgi:hypothetical protein
VGVVPDEVEPGEPTPAPTRVNGVDLSTLRPEVAGRLGALVAAMDAAAELAGPDVNLDGREAEAVAAVLAVVNSRGSVTQARMLPVIEADGIWSVESPSLVRWAARRFDMSVRRAKEQVRLGRVLRDDLPLTAAAAADGQISAEHAQVLAAVAATTEIRRAVLAGPVPEWNESWLLHQARINSVDDLRAVTRSWAAQVDPDADDRGYVQAWERQHFQLPPTTGGYHVQGFLTPEVGQALRSALKAVTPVPAAGDPSTADQRRAQGLGALANLVIRAKENGQLATGRISRARLNVLVSYETLTSVADRAIARHDGQTLPGLAPEMTAEGVLRGPQLEDGTPIPRILLERLACDGEFNRVIFGPKSEILDVGRSERMLTRARRKAIIARDRHCQFPGCFAPPTLCEFHHVEHWARDHGDTAVDKGIMLCWHHHGYVHTRGIEIHRRGARWVFTDAAGRELPDPHGDDDGAA